MDKFTCGLFYCVYSIERGASLSRVYKINLHCMGYDDYAPRRGSKTWKGYTWLVVPFTVALIYALLVVVALHQYAI